MRILIDDFFFATVRSLLVLLTFPLGGHKFPIEFISSTIVPPVVQWRWHNETNTNDSRTNKKN